MGKKSLLIHVLCSASFVPWAQATEEKVLIRGTSIPLPLEVRILIREMEDDEIRISGYNLYEASGKLINGESLRCQARRGKNLLSQLLSGTEALLKNPVQAWFCDSGGPSEALLRPLRLEAKGGFLTSGAQTFRDAIELIPRENGRLAVVNALKLEDYLVGIVNKEIRSDFPREAIKAQVVAARSYALATLADRRKNRVTLWDLQSNEMDQVYEGSHVEDARSHRFVKETLGEVLVHAGQVLRSFYHSSNGGFTEQPGNVWGMEQGELDRGAYEAQQSPVDRERSPMAWQINLSPQMGNFLFGVGRLKELRVLGRTTGQRVKSLMLVGDRGTQTLSGADFRRKLGNRWLKSTLFWVTKKNGSFLVEGRGFGHGVGMSQMGAREMARLGKNYKEILKFYYPRAELNKVAFLRQVEKPVPGEGDVIAPLAR